MNSLSEEKFIKMQEEAIEAAKSMKKSAFIKDPAKPKIARLNFNKEECENPRIEKKLQDTTSYSSDLIFNHNISQNSKNYCGDIDTVLLTFILILIFDKADKILIFALIYIML